MRRNREQIDSPGVTLDCDLARRLGSIANIGHVVTTRDRGDFPYGVYRSDFVIGGHYAQQIETVAA